jgi:hypothetical protein
VNGFVCQRVEKKDLSAADREAAIHAAAPIDSHHAATAGLTQL